MATRTFDELKSIRNELEEIEARRRIAEYFEEMFISDADKEKRIQTAYDFQALFRRLFTMMAIVEIARNQMIQTIMEEYIKVLDRYDYRPNMNHIRVFAETIVDNTLLNIDTDWYTSLDRSIKMAESETNNAANYEMDREAIEAGYTQKTWVTMQDNKVRDTHKALDGVTIDIGETFKVGMAEMRFPCDEELAFDYPEEIANCRCILEYS